VDQKDIKLKELFEEMAQFELAPRWWKYLLLGGMLVYAVAVNT